MYFVNMAVALAEAAQPGGIQSLTTLFLPLALMIGLMYFLMIRPQKKKEKALREQLNAMKVGDKCLTAGGIIGKVVNMKDDEVTIQTSVANTLITVKKTAITTVIKLVSEDE
jgi:preprotein translocase subunit YajC